MSDDEKIKYGIAVRKDDGNMKMTKKEVLEMAAEGKTVGEIVEYFIQGDESIRSMYTAKATLFVDGPKEKTGIETPKQKKTEKLQQDSVVTSLKMRTVEDTETGAIFELGDDALLIKLPGSTDSTMYKVQWDMLDYFMATLQKLKQIHEAV